MTKMTAFLKKLLGSPDLNLDTSGFTLEGDAKFSLGTRPGKLLGLYDRQAVEDLFGSLGISAMLEKMGFGRLKYVVDLKNYLDQRVMIYWQQATRDHLLVEIRLGLQADADSLRVQVAGRGYRFLLVHWLCMQNPRQDLDSAKRVLPGQDYGGLPVGYILLEVLSRMAKELGLDGLLGYPEYYHNAYLYARFFYFIHTDKQGEFLGLLRDLCLYPIDKISREIENQHVFSRGAKAPFVWKAAEQVMPLHADLEKYFQSPAYVNAVMAAMAQKEFYLKHHDPKNR